MHHSSWQSLQNVAAEMSNAASKGTVGWKLSHSGFSLPPLPAAKSVSSHWHNECPSCSRMAVLKSRLPFPLSCSIMPFMLYCMRCLLQHASTRAACIDSESAAGHLTSLSLTLQQRLPIISLAFRIAVDILALAAFQLDVMTCSSAEARECRQGGKIW